MKGIALILAAMLTLGSSRYAPSPPPSTAMKIATYNIHHGRGMDDQLDLPRIAEVLRLEGPDIVALQEVDRGAERSEQVHQAAKLAELLSMDYFFSEAIPFQGGSYGQAILSSLPLTQTREYELPSPEDREQRIAVAAYTAAHGQEFVFVGVHLDHQLPALRLAQAESLIESLADFATVFVAGDFNATPGSPTMTLFQQSGYRDICPPDAATFPADEPEVRIDTILVRSEVPVTVLDCRVLEEPVASDHRPVVAEVRFEESRNRE